MEWYLQVLRKYADFSGRARRKEYWMFVLFNIIIAIPLVIIDMALFGHYLLYIIYVLIILIPSIAVAVRRLHDIGKSGWFYLISLIPVVGAIILLIWFCKDGEAGTNKWGKNPKEI